MPRFCFSLTDRRCQSPIYYLNRVVNLVRLALPLQLRIRAAFTIGSIWQFRRWYSHPIRLLINETTPVGSREKVVNKLVPWDSQRRYRRLGGATTVALPGELRITTTNSKTS
jgi:hypothetical protein